MSAFCLWHCLFFPNTKVLFVSQGEDEAQEMVRKSHYIWDNLPPFLKLPIVIDGRGHVVWSNGSEMVALPSTAKAGHSTDATIVVRDELAFHENARASFSALRPTIDAGGQQIDLSKINKTDATNHFTERVRDAISGRSGAHFVFLGWRNRPTRQEGMTLEDWYAKEIVPKYTKLELEENYPETLEQALSIPESRSFFDQDALKVLLTDCCIEPLKDPPELDTRSGMIKVYKLPQVGRRYCLYTDVSDGFDDPHASVVIDWQTGEEMACSHGMVSLETCASIHDSLAKFYNKAHNNFDATGHTGGQFIQLLKDLGTPNVAVRRKTDGAVVEAKTGFWGSREHKELAFSWLKDAVATRAIIVHTREALMEMMDFIKPEKKDDKETPARIIKGKHDDWILAWAGVWYTRRYMPPGDSGKVVSFKYRQSW